MSTMKPATMAAALTASAQLIESLRLERDAAQREAAELREAGWQRDRRVTREVRHHVAEALATEMADRLTDDDGRAYIALDEAQRIARGGTQ
jgi:hypothetical protein